MNEKELIEEIGSFEREPLRMGVDKGPPGPGKPRELTETVSWDGWADEDQADICLIDFGESFFSATDSSQVAQPLDQQVPESIFENRLDYEADLWRAGIVVRNLCLRSSCVSGKVNCLLTVSCQIYTLVFNQRPFFTLLGDHDLICSMVDCVEKLPPHWHNRWVQMQKDAGQEANGRPGKVNGLPITVHS